MIYLILLLGTILRLISLNQSLWLDEATSALVAKMPLAYIFTKFLPGDFHPLLYYLILKYWVNVFGSSEVSLRIPSVIFGVLTIYFVYLIVRKISDKKTALIASSFSATSGLLIYYSQEARMYSLAALLVCISIYLFIEKKWMWFSILLILIGMTDYVSLLILPVFWIFGKKDIKKMFLAHIPLILAFALWSPIFISQLRTGFSITGTAWWQILGVASFKNAALIPVKFILGRISFDDNILYTAVVVFAAGLFGYLLFKAKKTSNLIWMWLIVPIILGIFLSFKIPTLSYFRFLFCLPALYILVAAGIEKSGRYKKLFLIIILIINILSSLYYLLNPNFWREDWRLAVKTIGFDIVVLPSDSQGEALQYYGKANQIVYYKDFNGGPKQIWLSRYVATIFDPGDLAAKKIESLGYNMTGEYNFNGVVMDKYAHRN